MAVVFAFKGDVVVCSFEFGSFNVADVVDLAGAFHDVLWVVQKEHRHLDILPLVSFIDVQNQKEVLVFKYFVQRQFEHLRSSCLFQTSPFDSFPNFHTVFYLEVCPV